MNGSYVLTAAGRIEMEDRKINILGITYTVKEVDCVDKYAGSVQGQINYYTCEIKIDKTLPKSLKEQVLLHELLHAVAEAVGLKELNEDEQAIQSLASALYCLFKSQTIFS